MKNKKEITWSDYLGIDVGLAENTCLAKVTPELAKEWHPTKNGELTPFNIGPSSGLKVWWKCRHGHEWHTSPNARHNGKIGCPYCSGRLTTRDNSLGIKNPDLSKEWNTFRNSGITPFDFSCGSHKRVWWRCNRGHEWEAAIKNRNKGTKCPYCANKKICRENSLYSTNTELAKEWHPTKNKELRPHDVTGGSNIKVWWKCKDNHEWEAVIVSRNSGMGCPYCSGQKYSAESRLSYYEAKKYIKKYNFKNIHDWKIFTKTERFVDLHLPRTPNYFYKNKGEWISWGDFLGTGNIHKKEFVTYQEAKDLIALIKLKSQLEWRSYRASHRKLSCIPSDPYNVYKKTGEWVSWPDFLGKKTNKINKSVDIKH